MNITIFYSSKQHPIFPYLLKWHNNNSNKHKISLINNISEIKNGDILFLIASSEIIKVAILKKFKKVLCVHESDLPKGRGWSPSVHLILNGEKEIPICLFEATEKVDSGDIWKKDFIKIEMHELANEINQKISKKTIELIEFAIDNFNSITTIPQSGEPSYFSKRTPEDSEIDLNKTIKEQINLLRIADQNRYPCFFNYEGNRYKISISKF